MRGLFILGFMVFSSIAMAQAVATPTYFDSTLTWLAANVAMIASGVGVIEVVLRLFPSLKPLSVLIPVQYALDGVAKILTFVSANILAPMISAFNVSSLK